MISVRNLARQSLLLTLCVGAIGVLGKAVFDTPKPTGLQEPAAVNFPRQVPLPATKFLTSKPLAALPIENKLVGAGSAYRYEYNSRPIDLEIRYITNGVANRPTMDVMLPIFTKIPVTALQSAPLREEPGVGFYSLFADKKTAYFGTCINPRGIATVTGDQFHANSNPNPLASGIPFDRVVPWLMGRQTLRDSRCLWTILSTPIDAAAPDATMKMLQTVGLNWTRWWQGNFPTI
ncbi:cyanoexosortase A system-associated protein [Chamaesiphon sp. OTE_8_metabat_110]|uniref:cyanoexosortase A system-associated protein n=1 Tax=Chamaesiphon sp. OTE_8_metabat_110 TaxID=2964696 RepID=UPI00286CB1D9|nr:cyanoexosortase A system-associated protein [Chamaesiphon sp. OTE_8_metabat_110]